MDKWMDGWRDGWELFTGLYFTRRFISAFEESNLIVNNSSVPLRIFLIFGSKSLGQTEF